MTVVITYMQKACRIFYFMPGYGLSGKTPSSNKKTTTELTYTNVRCDTIDCNYLPDLSGHYWCSCVMSLVDDPYCKIKLLELMSCPDYTRYMEFLT